MERFDDFVKLLDKAKTLIVIVKRKELLIPRSNFQINENRSEQEKDKVRALDTLAAYYVYRGNQERSQEVRRELFEQATLLYATADKFSRYDQNHLIGRAYFCLLEGRKEQEAEVQLDFVLKNLADVSSLFFQITVISSYFLEQPRRAPEDSGMYGQSLHSLYAKRLQNKSGVL